MENIAQKLRKAYDLLLNADTTDIDAYYLAVEEAQGYIAEALDIADNAPQIPRAFEDDEGCEFFIDDRQVSCEEFNDYFDAHDVGWSEDITEDKAVFTIHTDDRG
jgi:hypothetical protein